MRGGKAGDVGLAGHVFSSCDSLRSCLTIDLWTFLPDDVSLRYLIKSPSWILGMVDGGSGALGTKYMPHVLVKRSYCLSDGSFRAAARFCAGELMVQLGPSDFSVTSFTLGIRSRDDTREDDEAVGVGIRPEIASGSYLLVSPSECGGNTSTSELSRLPP
jgi:hypothetical protein